MRQDFEKARALLKEAGYDGTPIVYLHPMDQKVQRDLGTVIVNAMRRAGFWSRMCRSELRPCSPAGPTRDRRGRRLERVHDGFAGRALMDPWPIVHDRRREKAFIGWPCDPPLQALWQKFMGCQ